VIEVFEQEVSYPRKNFFLLLLLSVLSQVIVVFGSAPNIIEFDVAVPFNKWRGANIVVTDLDDDGDLDFVFRSNDALYAYTNDGSFMWSQSIVIPSMNQGTNYGAADVDGDGNIEIIALNNSNQIKIYNGSNGALDSFYSPSGTINLPTIGSNNQWAHIAIANLRGEGDRDAIVQTADLTAERSGNGYYINRNLLAVNLESTTGDTLWSVEQDDNVANGYYEGYWGQAHGPFFCADVDGDGLDEVVGGNMVDHDKTVVDFSDYTSSWVQHKTTANYDVDHGDAILVGDFNKSTFGLEWIWTEEDYQSSSNQWNTCMLHYDPDNPTTGILWRVEITTWYNPSTVSIPNNHYREPQNIAAGDYDTTSNNCEIWVRSRVGGNNTSPYDSQHPWVYSSTGGYMTDYRTDSVLPAGFNTHATYGNREGLETIWTIDWEGGDKEYIAAKARHTDGCESQNVGVFDAITGDTVWTTIGYDPPIAAGTVFVTDVTGDYREELIIYDINDTTIKIFSNADINSNDPKPDKWDDPLYKRLKQNWNYYSPGSYSQRTPARLKVRIFLEGAYNTNRQMTTSLKSYMPTKSLYTADSRIVNPIPTADITDWLLIQLRSTDDGHTVVSRSAFLRNDGYILADDGTTDEINLFVETGYYYIIVIHQNHLKVMSTDSLQFTQGSLVTYDFTTGSGQFYGAGGAKEVETGIWGMWAGDINQDGQITTMDYTNWYNSAKAGDSGYNDTDINMDSQVTTMDYTIWYNNAKAGASSSVP
jgi:hypothetical protein